MPQPDDKTRVPAATPSRMERGMMEILAQAQKAAASDAPVQVCGLKVRFSLEGDAEVSWDIRASQPEPGR